MKRTSPTANGPRSPGTQRSVVRETWQSILPLALLFSLIAGPAHARSVLCDRATCMQSGQAYPGRSASCAMARQYCRAPAQAATTTRGNTLQAHDHAALPEFPRDASPKCGVRSRSSVSPGLTSVPLFLWTRALLI